VIAVASLARFPRFIPPLADAFAREWPAWSRTVSRAELEAIFAAGSDGALPVVLVALEDDRVVGTVALRQWFAEEPMRETPWVRQLYVFSERRGRGVDRALMAAIEERARRLGYRELHAATNRIEPLLLRRGWQVFHRVAPPGEPMAWLRKSIRGSDSNIQGRESPKRNIGV
jgi:GNAT superfamily N-acetyltransferase